MRIQSITVVPWSLPLTAPFRVAARTAYEAHDVLMEIVSNDGQVGFGAGGPVEYITGENQTIVVDILRGFASTLIDRDVSRLQPLLQLVSEALNPYPAARATIEMALHDLWAKHWQIPLWQYFGGAQDQLITDVTIPIVHPDEAALLTHKHLASGFRCFKVKVGSADGVDEDLLRLRAVSSAAPDCGIRIDANQAFTPEGAVAFTSEATNISPRIEFIEQPTPKEDFEGLRYVRDRIRVPLFADEAARSPADVRRLIEMGAVDGVNVKLMKSGLVGAQQIISLCRDAGLGLMVGCMLESPIGMAAAASLVGGSGAFSYIDLDAHELIQPIPGIVGGFTTSGPIIELDRTSPGWGVALAAESKGTLFSNVTSDQ